MFSYLMVSQQRACTLTCMNVLWEHGTHLRDVKLDCLRKIVGRREWTIMIDLIEYSWGQKVTSTHDVLTAPQFQELYNIGVLPRILGRQKGYLIFISVTSWYAHAYAHLFMKGTYAHLFVSTPYAHHMHTFFWRCKATACSQRMYVCSFYKAI